MSGNQDQSTGVFDWKQLRERLQRASKSLHNPEWNLDQAEILQERARLAAQSIEPTSRDAASLDVVQFSIAAERYAIDARFVIEVVNQPLWTPLPHTPQILRGIHNRRGEVLAVFDVRKLLGIPITGSVDRWLLVVGEDRAEFGILVDDVQPVSSLPLDSVLRSATASQVTGSLVRGVTADAISILDECALLADDRLWIHATPGL